MSEMGRKNTTSQRPQRIKHRVEDHLARRAVRNEVERSYRDEAHHTTVDHGHITITFTDPSFLAV